MKRRLRLSDTKAIDIHYDETVYSPHYSSVDTIVLADFVAKDDDEVLDVSCGSGISGLGLKYLKPHIKLSMSDISEEAVRVAKDNANRLKIVADVFQNDLLDGQEHKWDIILANLPTYDSEDMKQELHGPEHTYFSHEKDGLYLYRRLLKQARVALKPGGCLICECQEKLQDKFKELAYNENYTIAIKNDYGFVLAPK